jgi:hypothetical protein
LAFICEVRNDRNYTPYKLALKGRESRERGVVNFTDIMIWSSGMTNYLPPRRSFKFN